jgi:hypothetical protein
MRILIIAMLSIAGMLLAAVTMAAAADGETVIKLGFVIRKEMIAPVRISGHNEAYSATLVLSGGNRVRELWQAQSVTGTNAQFHSDDSAIGTKWRVVSPNTIMASWRLSTYTKTVTVRVSGKSCSVSFSTSLLPGETEYQVVSRRAIQKFEKPEMIDPRCTIQ